MKNVGRMWIEEEWGVDLPMNQRENQIKQLHLIEYRMVSFFIVFVFIFISFVRMPNALYHYRTHKLALFRGKREFNKFKLKYLSEMGRNGKESSEKISFFIIFVCNFFNFLFLPSWIDSISKTLAPASEISIETFSLGAFFHIITNFSLRQNYLFQ